MSFTPDGTTSPWYNGNDDAALYPDNGELWDSDDHLKKLTANLDALKLRLGISSTDTGGSGNEPFWKGFNNLADRLASLAGGVTDHGALTGLGDDDHPQYHNDARGDARYYTKTLLDTGQLDTRYFTEAEHINASAGAGDAGKPIVLDSNGQIDGSMLPAGSSGIARLFIPAKHNAQFLTYDVLSVGALTPFNFSFLIPEDFGAIVEHGLVLIVETSEASAQLDYESNYSQPGTAPTLGEPPSQHNESGTSSQLLNNAPEMREWVIGNGAAPAPFTNIQKGDAVGLECEFRSNLNNTVHVLGFYLYYSKA